MMIQGVREIDLELGRECLTLESEKLRVERTKKRACSSSISNPNVFAFFMGKIK